jgi:hypothetical protein
VSCCSEKYPGAKKKRPRLRPTTTLGTVGPDVLERRKGLLKAPGLTGPYE